MSSSRVMAWAACALLAAHTTAQAQSPASGGPSRAPIEITPHVSTGSGQSTGGGVAVRWDVAPKLGLELETEVRRTQITAVNFALNLLYDLPAIGRVVPYASAGIGMEQYAAAVFLPHLGVVQKTGTALTVNAGGGLKIPVDDRWGIRTDARWINGIGREAPEHWRVYNGATFNVGKR